MRRMHWSYADLLNTPVDVIARIVQMINQEQDK